MPSMPEECAKELPTQAASVRASSAMSETDRNAPVRSVTAVARTFNVSREVILRRVLDRGWIGPETYRDSVQAWASERKQVARATAVAESFPSFWDEMEKLATDGVLVSCREVAKELGLLSSAEYLNAWVDRHPQLFLDPTEEEMERVAEIFRVPHFRQLIGQ